MRSPLVTLAGLYLLGVSLAACKKTPEPTGSSGPAPLPAGSGPKATSAPTASSHPVGVTWVDPPSWTREPKQSAMRKATYRVPRAPGDSEDGELAVFYFGPGQGGSIDANVERWVKQFDERKPNEPRRADRTVNGLRQHTVEIDEGTFDPGMPGMAQKPRAGYALLGAIVEAPSGSYFFKLTGPKATIKAAREQFYAFLDSVKQSS